MKWCSCLEWEDEINNYCQVDEHGFEWGWKIHPHLIESVSSWRKWCPFCMSRLENV